MYLGLKKCFETAGATKPLGNQRPSVQTDR